jgi:hypothetical protein
LQREREFFSRIQQFRPAEVRLSLQNPLPDYYGEGVKSVSGYRAWLRKQRDVSTYDHLFCFSLFNCVYPDVHLDSASTHYHYHQQYRIKTEGFKSISTLKAKAKNLRILAEKQERLGQQQQQQ